MRRTRRPRLQELFELSPTGIALVGVTDGDAGRIVVANPAFDRLIGRGHREVEGELAWALLHRDDRPLASEQLARLIAGSDGVVEGHTRLLCDGGGVRWVHLNARLLRDERDEPEAVMVHITDLTDLRRRTEGRGEVARRLLEAQALARLGSFEWLPAEDSVLISDETFRMFGLRPGRLPGVLSAWESWIHEDDVATFMDALTGTLANGAPRTLELRFKSASGRFRWAEARMSADRAEGRAVKVWGTIQDIHERKLREVRLLDEVEELAEVDQLRIAIADHRLRLDGQRIIELGTSESVMSELLVRLVDADRGTVSASEFLCLAERHGLIGDIDRWVLEQATDLAAGGTPVALNVSARTMSDQEFAAMVVRLLGQRRANPALMTFEITETSLIENFEHARRFAMQLESLGCRLALDDFGTGYGTFTYLKQLPAHYLKIDREFVGDAMANPRSRAVVAGIVALADSFGQRTIAEGIENRQTLNLMRELGVDYAQGFYIGEPSWIAGASNQKGSHGESG